MHLHRAVREMAVTMIRVMKLEQRRRRLITSHRKYARGMTFLVFESSRFQEHLAVGVDSRLDLVQRHLATKTSGTFQAHAHAKK